MEVSNTKKIRDKVAPYLFILPHYIFFSVFFAIPAVSAFVISFYKWDFITKPEFIGIQNYKQILVNTDSIFFKQFWNGLLNTVKYVVFSVPLMVVIPLMIAAALRTKPRGAGFFQSVFYIPYLLSVATVVLTWRWLLDRSLGIVNSIFHLDIGWTVDQPYFWIAVVIMSVWWGIGGNMVIFLAGMADISEELYEAADIDGANSVSKFYNITLPGLKNQIMYAIIMTMIASFNIYGQPLMLAKDIQAVTDDKKVLMIVIQQMAFGANSQQAGMATAMAVIMGLIIILLSIFQFKLSNSDS